ncbi:FHA domain containing protein [Planktothrix serta PCC 8927]|uniref:FHA domain containing protein n=2 Tax=Planktothrix TaxID=54304 RepID=A0A7Z9C2S1_9CYAN|nr:FHA domain containing protein [Planktothrix serta PCC 8927]
MLQEWTKIKTPLTSLLAALIIVTIVGCGNSASEVTPHSPLSLTIPQSIPPIVDVSPPNLIQKLHQSLDAYQPQVSILNPKPDALIEDDTINLQLQVQGLPLFQDPPSGLGPHLQVILDNQPNINIYDISTPITFSNLDPGTHTLRVFAAYPWDESYKNEGSFAQSTFHIFTKTDLDHPNQDLPLLTYNRPQGVYGAEPILLDFYLSNAPLHLVAQEDPTDEIVDWQIRITVNGESFTTNQWQPLYLKGFKPGKNWVKIEYLDEQGNPVDNVFNKTARVITYDPNLKNTLSQLIQGKLSWAEVKGIVNPNSALPDEIQTPEPEIISPVEPTSEPAEISIPVVEPTPEPEDTISEPEEIPVPLEDTISEPEEIPVPLEEIPSETESYIPEPEQIPSEIEPEPPPVEPTRLEAKIEETIPKPLDIQADIPSQPAVSPEPQPQKWGGFLSRFRLPFLNQISVTSNPPTTLPEIVDQVPIPEPTTELQPGETPNLVPELPSETENPISATEVSPPESTVEPDILPAASQTLNTD